MKKFLVLLCTFLITSMSALCVHLDPVKWYTMPLNVYIPAHPKAPLMQKAFLDLENNSGNTVKFRFLKEQAKNRAHISVSFVPKCNHDNAVGVTYQNTRNYAYQKNTIKIGLLNPSNNRAYSDKQLYVIMLHEAGHSIGLEHSMYPRDIMFHSINENQALLTDNDKKQIKMLYGY